MLRSSWGSRQERFLFGRAGLKPHLPKHRLKFMWLNWQQLMGIWFQYRRSVGSVSSGVNTPICQVHASVWSCLWCQGPGSGNKRLRSTGLLVNCGFLQSLVEIPFTPDESGYNFILSFGLLACWWDCFRSAVAAAIARLLGCCVGLNSITTAGSKASRRCETLNIWEQRAEINEINQFIE